MSIISKCFVNIAVVEKRIDIYLYSDIHSTEYRSQSSDSVNMCQKLFWAKKCIQNVALFPRHERESRESSISHKYNQTHSSYLTFIWSNLFFFVFTIEIWNTLNMKYPCCIFPCYKLLFFRFTFLID